MKKIYMKRFIAAALSAVVGTAMLPCAVTAEGEEAAFRCAAYYDDGVLVYTKLLEGKLKTEETDALAEIYAPDNADKAKVFEWTENLEPIGKSGHEVDISGAGAVILHTNDMHGSVADSDSIIGLDRIAGLKELDGAILADGGDAAQGVAIASQSKGEDVITIMNAAGYDVMAAGNHEFDYGLEQFAKLRQQAQFPIISANTYKDGALLCADGGKNNGANVMIEKNGINIGIFALTTRDTMTSTKPENLAGVEFKDEVETAKAQVAELDAAGADVIIAVTHMGNLKYGTYTSAELAEAMKDTELDAIIDGHSHTIENEKVGNITIAQTGTGGANVGRMAIDVAEDGTVNIKETLLSRAAMGNIAPNADVTKVITDTSAELNETLKTEIGETKTTLWGGSIRKVIAESRAGETNFGSLICDAMIEEAKNIIPDTYKDADGNITAPIVAIENGGGFRGSVPNGKITLEHIVNALPYANTVRIKEITPAELYTMLEGYVSSVTAQDAETGFLTASYSGSFPQIGGMRFRYDPNKPEGEKIEIVSLIQGNTDLDRNDTSTKLILASHDYIIDVKDMIAEGSGLVETVIAYINSLTENGKKPLEMPVTMGRISAIAHDPDNYTYTAHIALKGADMLKEGDEIEVYVDGERYDKTGVIKDEQITQTTEDQDGNEAAENKVRTLQIELPDGPHAIKLYADQEEAYVNNYSGNGILYEYNGLTLGYPELEYNAILQ